MALKTKFLEEFAKELIINSYHGPIIIKKVEIKQEMPNIPSLINNTKHEELTFQQIPERGNEKPLIVPEKPLEFREDEFYNGLYLGKLAKIIVDPTVISIECPGFGKYVTIRRINSQTITKIILSQEEIYSIIQSFSEHAKIPRIGGIFKAIVNNLLITAIETDINSRFIITKIAALPSPFL